MEYESIVETICTKEWKANQEEMNGGIGVACVLAFMKGVRPRIDDMARHLRLSREEVELPFNRLLVNGIFNMGKYDIRNDKALLGKTDSHATRNSWCQIAGVASGFCGLRED
jgi:hypothetical protein